MVGGLIAAMDPDLVVDQVLPTWVDVLAIVLGAVSGSIIARRWGADIAGVLIVGIVSGLGGGFIRDLLLNRTPIALTNSVMIPAALVAASVGFLVPDVWTRLSRRLDIVIVMLDAAFLGVYATIGTEKSLLMNLPAVSCVFVGVLSGIGGGLLRDVLLNNEPEVLRPGALNAVAAVVGCTLYAVISRQWDTGGWVAVGCVAVIMGLRLASVVFELQTPVPRDMLTETKRGKKVARRIHLDRLLPPDPVPPAAPAPSPLPPAGATPGEDQTPPSPA